MKHMKKEERSRTWSGVSTVEEQVQVCRFFVQNKCLRGDACPYSHDLSVDGEPDDWDPCKSCDSSSKGAVCGICLQSVWVEGRRFGLLPRCSHVFCLDCIMEWRSKSRCKKCPLCRIPSFFVIPSCRFAASADLKKRRVEEYLAFLSERPCIYFLATELCPYGDMCFFKHGERTGGVCHLEAKVKLVFTDGAHYAFTPVAGS
jgi:E3 ubiquitin-protein ligase makorin